MLKVRFAEADRSKLTNFGINIFSTGATIPLVPQARSNLARLLLRRLRPPGSVIPPSTPQQFLPVESFEYLFVPPRH